MDSMRAMIRRCRKAGTDTVDAEKELCWLEREEELRDTRKDLHKDYVAEIRAEQYAERKREIEALAEYEMPHSSQLN